MRYLLMRLTPTKTLTYNNRWYQPVKPKKNLFFIPPDANQFFYWLDFLTTTHKKTFLYLHVIMLKAVRKRTRTLLTWKGNPLKEVMINQRNYEYRFWFYTQRVTRGMKHIPIIIKRHVKKPFIQRG